MTPPRTAVRRSASLAGEEAIAWFRSAGYRVLDPRAPRVYVDEVHGADLRIARYWHSEATLLREAPARPRAAVLLQVDGGIELEAPTWSDRAGPGSIAVLPAFDEVRITAAESGAHLEVEFDADQLPEAVRRGCSDGGLLDADVRPFSTVLISTLNAAFNSELGPQDPGFPAFRLAVRSLVSGLLTVDAAARGGLATRRDLLVDRARRMIAERAAERAFSTAVLSDELRISPRSLQEAFAAHGSSPAAEIRAERAEIARALRESGDRALSSADVARLAGFGSASSMRRAL